MVLRENKNNAYAKFGGTNKEYYGIFRSGLLLLNTVVYIVGRTYNKRAESRNWPEADQLVIYKRSRGVEPGTTCNKPNGRAESGPLTRTRLCTYLLRVA